MAARERLGLAPGGGTFRGSRVMDWKNIRLNMVASFVLDRQHLEYEDRRDHSRLRWREFKRIAQQDSASEDDEDEQAAGVDGDLLVRSAHAHSHMSGMAVR